MSTNIKHKIFILSELWQEYKGDSDWSDFFDYNDIGLPMAFMIDQKLVKETNAGRKYINQTFELLVETLGFDDDLEWDRLEQMIDDSSKTGWENDED
jgi:hypothetical protein